MIEITQGASYAIFIPLTMDGMRLTPDMVEDVRICIGDGFHKTYLGGGLKFDAQTQRWWIMPTQAETLAMQEGVQEVWAHVKYQDGSCYPERIDRVKIVAGCGCKEAF